MGAEGRLKLLDVLTEYQKLQVLCSAPLTFPHVLIPNLGRKVYQEVQTTKLSFACANDPLTVGWCMAEHRSHLWVVSLPSTNTISMCTQFMVSLFLKRDKSTQHVDFAILCVYLPKGVQRILSRGGSYLRK